MKTRNAMIVFMMAVTAACGSCGKAPENPEFNGTMYAYGSSISVGFDDESPYVKLIAKKMKFKFINHAYGGSSLLDKAPSGAPSQYDVISNEHWDVDDVVHWDIGINDAILHGGDAQYLSKFESNLMELLYKIQASSVIAYIGTPVHNCNEPRFANNSDEDKYGAIAKRLVYGLKNPRIKIVDYSYGFIPTEDNTRDCLHPNQTGHGQMADFFFLVK